MRSRPPLAYPASTSLAWTCYSSPTLKSIDGSRAWPEGAQRPGGGARRWSPAGPDWLVLDVYYLALAQEAEILARLGLTLDEALALVG